MDQHESHHDETVAALQRTIENLRAALDHRDVISTAKGLMMAQMCCDAGAAFDLLARQSQHQNVKVHVLAVEFVERFERFARERQGSREART